MDARNLLPESRSIATKPHGFTTQPVTLSTSADERGLENYCIACQRLFRADTEVAKPCSFKSYEELNRSEDEFHITKRWLVHQPEGGTGLRDAAAQGCPICVHIWSSFSTHEQERICQDTSNSGFAQSDFVTRYNFEMQMSEKHLEKFCIMQYSIRTLLRNQDEGSGRWYIRLDKDIEKDFYVIPCSNTPEQRITKLDLNECSESCLEQVNTWLNACTTNHECSSATPMNTEVQYPTRLISVGTIGHPELKLCNGRDINNGAPYLSLSHCWGKTKFFTLLQSNLSELQTVIPTDKLTKTFRDAVELTRKLQIKYLWIDSLCIIQDSKDDWAFESARMMNVYSNSYLNIAATGATDGSRGLFFERGLGDVPPTTLRIPYQKGKSSSARDHDIDYVRMVFHNMRMTDSGGKEYSPGKPETFYFTASDLWANGVIYSPLGKRAWCLQERVLAPRTIHFGEHQLFFECQFFQACSRFPRGVPSVLIPSLEDKSTFSLINAAKVAKKDDNSSLKSAYDTWCKLVETYSACSLTFGKDKLVAISGMASFIGSRLHMSQYMAGIWSYGALNQLLWAYESKSEGENVDAVHYRPKEYRAPSWSWASVDYAIKFSPPGRAYLASIMDGQTWPKVKENEYGEMEYAVVVLKGVLLPARAGRATKQLSVSLMGWVTVLQFGQTEAVFEPVFDDWNDSRKKQFKCLPIALTQFYVVGLVLVEDEKPRVTSDVGTIFRRVGHFELHKDLWSKFRGRSVPERYREERTLGGELVRSYPNIPPKEPDYDAEDLVWAEKNAQIFVLA